MSDEKEIERKVAIDDEVIRMLRMRTEGGRKYFFKNDLRIMEKYYK